VGMGLHSTPSASVWVGGAVPSHEVRRLKGRSRPQPIWSACQPAILSSYAEENRSSLVSTLAKILKGLQTDVHSR
jgi:hypothetical protein